MCRWWMTVHVRKLKPEEKIFRWTSLYWKSPSWIIIFLVMSSCWTIHYSLNESLSFLYVLVSWVQFIFLKYVTLRSILLVTLLGHGFLLTALLRITVFCLHYVEPSFLPRHVSSDVIASSVQEAVSADTWHFLSLALSYSWSALKLEFILFEPCVMTLFVLRKLIVNFM